MPLSAQDAAHRWMSGPSDHPIQLPVGRSRQRKSSARIAIPKFGRALIQKLQGNECSTVTLNPIDELEASLYADCTIVCDVGVEYIDSGRPDERSTLAVAHNENMITLDLPTGALVDDNGGRAPAWNEALAWVKALHFCADSSERLRLPQTRLINHVPKSGPRAYDYQHLVKSGTVTVEEARARMGLNEIGVLGFVICKLHHNRVMREVGEHLTYKVIDTKGSTVTEAYIKSLDGKIESRLIMLTFARLGS